MQETPLHDGDDDDAPTAPFWMTTFSDMMTLLLTFFVMLVAMSEVEVKKFQDAISYFKGGRGVMIQEASLPTLPPSTRREEFQTQKQAKQYERLLQYIQENDLEEKVQVDLTEEGVHVVITDSVMFASGSAILVEPSRTVLGLIGGMVSEQVHSVIVEGHTDDRPIETAQFPSNWELSTARAAAVVRFMQGEVDVLDPGRYAAIGYGPYHPVTDNETAVGRSRNRRVEILLSWEPWNPKNALKQNTMPLPTRPKAAQR